MAGNTDQKNKSFISKLFETHNPSAKTTKKPSFLKNIFDNTVAEKKKEATGKTDG